MTQTHSRSRIATMTLLFLGFCLFPLVSAQWIDPPALPKGASLTDYTSGALSPIEDYHMDDAMIAHYSTPQGGYGMARCAKPGHTKPILPSNGTFASREGRTTPDGIWEFMPIYMNTGLGNRISRGSNIWLVFWEDYVPAKTNGHSICWLELYEGWEEQIGPLDCDSTGTVCPGGDGLTQVITVDGEDTRNYFATTPFVVQTGKREDGADYNWDGSITIQVGSEPTGNAAPGTIYTGLDGGSGLLYAFMSFLGLILGMA